MSSEPLNPCPNPGCKSTNVELQTFRKGEIESAVVVCKECGHKNLLELWQKGITPKETA
jgi:ssDNA-binding Zn-finger/Zn-ribbon topoisomerase 1